MSVGDVTSDARGSGARYNDGKLQMDLIPVYFWLENWLKHTDVPAELQGQLEALSAFQLGDDRAVGRYLVNMRSSLLQEAAQVFAYGAKKYAAWNWAKGMAWSVPIGCILRHAQAILRGEPIDAESGCTHDGHIVCNLIMLDWFVYNYPEGDDRPPSLQLDDDDDEASAEEIFARIITAVRT